MYETRGDQERQGDLNAAEVRLDPGTTKHGRGRARMIYLDRELLDVMQEQHAFVLNLQRERGKIIRWGFVNPETADRIRYFRRLWIHACIQPGLSGRIFHDFRRAAVRNMVRAGVPERAKKVDRGGIEPSTQQVNKPQGKSGGETC